MTDDMINRWLFKCPRCVMETIAMGREKRVYVTKDSTSVPEFERRNGQIKQQIPDIAYKI
jgi:hypothetical protein